MLSLCKIEIVYWKSVSTFGDYLYFQYHSCEEIVYFKGYATYFRFSHIPKHGEPAEVKPMLSLCKIEIDVLKFSIHFWGTSSISVPQLWRDSLLFSDFSTTFIQYILHTEVTANQLKSNRCFLCARLKSMYWNSVSTFGALLQFQYHSCEEIVYFSRDFSTTFIQYIQHTEVTANQLKSNRCFLCARLKSMYWNSVSTFGMHFFTFSTTAVKR